MTNTSTASSATPRSTLAEFLQPPSRLTPEMERRFQADYYARIRPGLRLVSLLLAGLVAAQTLVQSNAPARSDLAVGVPQIAFWLIVFGLTWTRGFGRAWQPTLVCLGWVAAALALGNLGHVLGGAGHAQGGDAPPHSPAPQQKFFFALQMVVLMATLSVLRLSFRAAATLQVGVLAVGLWSFAAHLPTDVGRDLHFIFLPALVLLLALLLAAFIQEQLARTAIYASYLLEKERDSEQRKREQTEGQLKVLAQAIGGIVHDLGNPLTTVMLGAELLDFSNEPNDTSGNQQISESILDGAQMLDALRLSLIEQVRVLEGKPIPVNLRPELLRPILATGARFQSPRFVNGRGVTLEETNIETDIAVVGDRLKLVTVFMNLIGNAFKYSDGEVRVLWKTEGESVLVGVLDQGKAGRGISEAQARQLFVAFGRLETHAQVEGTGLGLVSAQKIIEAHGGEIFVEGHQGGILASPPFSTAKERYSSLLPPGFLTGFVVAWPGRADDDP